MCDSLGWRTKKGLTLGRGHRPPQHLSAASYLMVQGKEFHDLMACKVRQAIHWCPPDTAQRDMQAEELMYLYGLDHKHVPTPATTQHVGGTVAGDQTVRKRLFSPGIDQVLGDTFCQIEVGVEGACRLQVCVWRCMLHASGPPFNASAARQNPGIKHHFLSSLLAERDPGCHIMCPQECSRGCVAGHPRHATSDFLTTTNSTGEIC
jgi:hypothetical protein